MSKKEKKNLSARHGPPEYTSKYFDEEILQTEISHLLLNKVHFKQFGNKNKRIEMERVQKAVVKELLR